MPWGHCRLKFFSYIFWQYISYNTSGSIVQFTHFFSAHTKHLLYAKNCSECKEMFIYVTSDRTPSTIRKKLSMFTILNLLRLGKCSNKIFINKKGNKNGFIVNHIILL